MEKIFESFLNLFSPFFSGAQTLDFIKENSKSFLNSIEEEIPPNVNSLEIYKHNDYFFLNSFPFISNEKNFKKYFQTELLFEKLGFKGMIIKKSIKEENLIFYLQDLQKGEIKSNPWIKTIEAKEENAALNLRFNILKAIKQVSLIISKKNFIEKNIKSGGIISYTLLREEIQRFYKILCQLEEKAMCLIPFFLKKNEKFIPFFIMTFVFLKPLKLLDEIIEDLLFSTFFYDLEDKKNWVSLIQAKNFSNGGFLSFLSSCNHPNIVFTLFYCANKYVEFLFSSKTPAHPSEALQKLYEIPEISDEIKEYIVSILGKIPPSSPALTEDCEPCLVLSKNEIAIYQENKFILKEGKAEKPVPYEQFPFNPLYIVLNLDIIK